MSNRSELDQSLDEATTFVHGLIASINNAEGMSDHEAIQLEDEWDRDYSRLLLAIEAIRSEEYAKGQANASRQFSVSQELP